ncbi:MAG: 3'-5' exonuclease [Thiomicrorhabdus sp.]|jgi:DNA polymerase III alpha subunit (gram-positive type)|nr:3'-5' exonuclease [Thiomicrorhabdus sp.]
MSEESKVVTEETKVLLFDVESSGFIKKALAADDPEQAWTVQVGAILATQNENLEKMDLIIQSNGREINYHAEKIHGISAERSDEEGLPELEVAEAFGLMLQQADLIVCHNFDFDWAFAKHLLERNVSELSDEARSAFFLDLPSFCTMKDKTVKKYVQAKNVKGHLKWPKLVELHEKLFGVGFDDAHDAFADITATKNCFFKLLEREIVTVNL